MQPQKFIAASMKEALRQVRETMGDDAIILKSEKVKPAGVMGFVRQDMIEITAAPNGFDVAEVITGPEFAQSLDTADRRALQPIPMTAASDELERLRGEISRLNGELSEIGKYFKYNNLPSMPAELTNAWEALGRTGMDSHWATDIAQEALVQLGPQELISAERIEQFVLDRISDTVRSAPILKARRKSAYKICLVGLPGAGKTTLLQKLSSDPLAYGKRKVGLLTLDTYRVAAVEQLKAFARISGSPLEVIYRPDQIETALHRLAACEVILIDSAGVSPRDTERMSKLAALMDALDPDEIHHVINSMLRDDEMQSACAAYRDLGPTHLSFTRLDETHRMGYLLNIAKFARKPLGWLTKGQAFVNCLEKYNSNMLRDWVHNAEAPLATDFTAHKLMRLQ